MGDSRGGEPQGCCAKGAPLRRVALLTALWGLALLPSRDAAAQPRSVPPSGKPAPWTQVNRLITGQRLTEAVRLLQATHKAALAAERADDAAHAAIRLAQVRMTLSHYELAVTVLHEQLAWQRQWQSSHGAAGTEPGAGAAPSEALLALFYSQALLQYAQMYSFQVSRRERSAAPLPAELSFQNTLRAWTRQQLLAEAQLAMAAAWEQRAALGALAAASFPEYIEPGTLPREERPTLRDLLTYLYVDLQLRLLHDRPEAQRFTEALQVSELLDNEGAGIVQGPQPQMGYLQPLETVAVVQSDLMRWHRTAGRVGPWVAARLELMARLHAELGDANQRAQVRLRLLELLSEAGDLPIAARVHATLAQLLRLEAQRGPDAEAAELLGRALAIAMQGARRFPGAAAGQLCRRIAQSLTAPEFHLESQAAAAPGQPALQAAYRNLTLLHFRAYSYDPLSRLLAGGNGSLAPSGAELQSLLRTGKPVAVWSAPLQATAELGLRRAKVVPPLREPGTYLIVASPRADFTPTNNHVEAVRLTLSDLVLWATTGPRAVRVTAVSGSTGEPLPDVELSSYAAADAANQALPPPSASGRGALTPLQRRRTGADGSAELSPADAASGMTVVGQLGRESALVEIAASQEPEEPEAAPPARIATDRSVYQPQQKLRWRVAAAKSASERSLSPPDNADGAPPLTMALLDAELQEVARAAVTTNPFGTAAGEFLLPRGRPLGTWRLVLGRGAARSGESLVRVEEPPPAGIVLTLAGPEAPRLGQAVTLCGAARYGAGGPVQHGFLRYKVTRQTRSLAGAEAAASSPASTAIVIASGTKAVPADGRFTIDFTAAEPMPDRSDRGNSESGISRGSPAAYRFRAAVELWADDGRSGAGQRSFELGTVLMQAEIRSEREFLRSDEPVKLELIRHDLEGRPEAGAASWQLLRLPPQTDPAVTDQPLPLLAGGAGSAALAQLRERPDGALHARGELMHAADGRVELGLPGLPAGAYRLRYKGRDRLGRAYETARELIVVPRSGRQDAALGLHAWLLRERASVRVGEIARFAVGSAIDDQALWLELRRADQTVQTRVLHAGRDPMLVELPLQPTDRGPLVATLTAVRDHQLLRLEQRVMVEEAEPVAPPALQLAFAPFRDPARPGSRQSVRLTVKTASGAIPGPGTVELFAYACDCRRERCAERMDRTALYASEPDRAEAAPAAGFVHSLGSQAADWQSEDPPRPDADRAAAQPDRLRLRLNFALLSSGRSFLRGRDMAAAPEQLRSPLRRGGDEKGGPSSGSAPDGELFPVLPAPLTQTPLFLPQLPLADDGSAVLEFTVPAAPDLFYLRAEAQSRDESTGTATHAVARLPEAQRCP